MSHGTKQITQLCINISNIFICIKYNFLKSQHCIRTWSIATFLPELRNKTHTIRQTCSYSLPALASCRKANIGLGGWVCAGWIRKHHPVKELSYRLADWIPCCRSPFSINPKTAFTVQPGGCNITQESASVVWCVYLPDSQDLIFQSTADIFLDDVCSCWWKIKGKMIIVLLFMFGKTMNQV